MSCFCRELYHAQNAETLFGFLMLGMLFAERTVFGNSKPVRIVTLVLIAIVISAFALSALEGDFSPC